MNDIEFLTTLSKVIDIVSLVVLIIPIFVIAYLVHETNNIK